MTRGYVVSDAVRASLPHVEVAGDLALLKKLVLALKPLPYESPRPRWSLVSQVLGHGSGVSWRICDALGVNPDEDVPAEAPPEWMTELVGEP